MDLKEYKELEGKDIPVVVDTLPGGELIDEGINYNQDFSGIIVYSFHETNPFTIGEEDIIYSKNEEGIN
ncbi:hypothetical protein P4G96_27060 [Bacillus cereus]|nr:hypothetical protein [Bacillus cereus]